MDWAALIGGILGAAIGSGWRGYRLGRRVERAEQEAGYNRRIMRGD